MAIRVYDNYDFPGETIVLGRSSLRLIITVPL